MAEQIMSNYSVSDSETKGLKNSVTDSDKVDRIANTLVDKLSNPERRAYYCKVAWSLPEFKIWSNLEQALKGRSPQRYFTFLCQKDMR